MNTEQVNAIGQYAANRIQHILQEKADLENILNIFGKEILEPKSATKTEKPSLEEIGSLRYVDKTSDKGAYKTASLTDNPNNPAFLKLQKYLKDHNNFAILHGYKIWNFQNSDLIGRRKQ